MEVPSVEGEMPIPLNSTYGHASGHMMHHHDHHPAAIISYPSGPHTGIDEDHLPSKKPGVRYRECLKNHAAGMGGNATDGCGEFMASGEEGTLEALTCSACACHRNFHRKEVEGGDPDACRIGRKLFVGHHKGSYVGPDHHLCGHHGGAIRAVGPHPMIMSYSMAAAAAGTSDQSDDQDGVVRAPHQKKRFRTKFTAEQKEKMLNFAEKVGWKIQKQEEGVVQQFCQEVGVKRRVLKVWMHNNKHTLAKKNIHSDPPQNQL